MKSSLIPLLFKEKNATKYNLPIPYCLLYKKELVAKEILSKYELDKYSLLHTKYIMIHEEVFEPKSDEPILNPIFMTLSNVTSCRYDAIERVRNFERLQQGIPLKQKEKYIDFLNTEYYTKEFEITEIIKRWKITLLEVFPFIRLVVLDKENQRKRDNEDEIKLRGFLPDGIQIYGDIRKGEEQIRELVGEYKALSKIDSYTPESHFMIDRRSLIYYGHVDFLLNRNDAYRTFFTELN